MIPPQQLIVTYEYPSIIAAFWQSMTEEYPDVFNACFIMAPGSGRDD